MAETKTQNTTTIAPPLRDPELQRLSAQFAGRMDRVIGAIEQQGIADKKKATPEHPPEFYANAMRDVTTSRNNFLNKLRAYDNGMKDLTAENRKPALDYATGLSMEIDRWLDGLEKDGLDDGDVFSFEESPASREMIKKLHPSMATLAYDLGAAIRNIPGTIKNAWDAMGRAFSKVADKVGDVAGKAGDAIDGTGKKVGEAAGDAGEDTKGFFSKIKDTVKEWKAGNIIGALLGAGAAYLAGSVFGNGPMKLIFMGLLMPFFAFLGANHLGPTIGGWLGGNKNRAADGQAQGQVIGQQGPSQNQGAGAPEANPNLAWEIANFHGHIPTSITSSRNLLQVHAYVDGSMAMNAGSTGLGSMLPNGLPQQAMSEADQVVRAGRLQMASSQGSQPIPTFTDYGAPAAPDQRQPTPGWSMRPAPGR